MNNLITLRNIQKIQKSIVSSLLKQNVRALSASPATDEEIVIPKRIPRSPTDILKALSATVGRDPTAAHYKYHDDPFLIPASNIGKRSFALAQESGRKAARWIRQQDREWFNHIVCDPQIDAFLPRLVYTEDSKVEEQDLQDLITNVQVSDAILVYNLLQKNGQSISDDTKLKFLQLIAYYNGEDTLDEEWLEERWFRQGVKGKERQRKTWKDGDLAKSIFNEMENKTSQAYCVMIRGMAKYFQIEKAFALYQEALDKGIELDTPTYNSMISVCNYMKDNADLRWDLAQQFLRTMKENNVTPNLGTLNALLKTFSSLGSQKLAKGCTLKTLAEFKNLGIEPSLASWYYVLITFCKERGTVSHVLIDILNEIEGKSFEIQDEKDTFFFVTAMDICRNHLNDKELAKRVDNLLHTGNNYNLIGDSYKESIYYRNYMGLMCLTESLDDFMEFYNRLVPNIYTPEPGIMNEVLKAVERNGAIEHVPLLWSHLVIFDYVTRENMLSLLVQTMINNPPNMEIQYHANLPEQFNNITSEIWEKLNDLSESRPDQFRWAGGLLGDLLLLFCRGGEFEKATLIFQKLNKSENEMIGEPSPASLEAYAKFCIEQKQPSLAINCLQYSIENGYPEGKTIGEELLTTLTLDELQSSKVKRLIGQSVPE
uniref:Small ribosomal subunit protein mS39 n=1 Tax=Culicoides sonorensis TaxID=179676 RepID=A0A336MAF5_CULSO